MLLKNPWIIWFPAALFYCYQFVLRVSPGVMRNELMLDFSIDAGTFGSLASFYYWGYSLLQVPLGVLSDYFGPRKLLALGSFLCAGATTLFSLSNDLYLAQLSRFLIGVGSSCAFLGSIKLCTLWFPIERLPLVTSATIFLGTIGANFGGAPLRILVNYYTWRDALLMVAFLGVLIGIFIWMFSQERPQKKEKPKVFEGLKLALKTPQVWLGCIYGFLIYTPLSIFADLWGVGFLEKMYHISPETAAAYTNLIYIGLGLGGLFYVWFLSKFITMITSLRLTSITVCISFSTLAFIPDIPLSIMAMNLFILGVMISGRAVSFAVVCAHMPIEFSGVTIGLTNMCIMLSGVIFQPLVGVILDSFLTDNIITGDRSFEVMYYRISLLIVPVCVAASFFVSLFLKEPVRD